MAAKRCQQDELYAAEAAVEAVTGVEWLGTHADVVGYINGHITRSRWYLELVAPKISELRVYESRHPFSFASHVSDQVEAVSISKMQRNVETVVHEIAHCVSHVVNGSKSHDPWFARTYLEMVWYVRGPAAYDRLATSFTSHGIEVADKGIAWQRKGLIVL